jgi:hypothetical protein
MNMESRFNIIGACPKCGRTDSLVESTIVDINVKYFCCVYDITCRYSNRGEMKRNYQLEILLK